MCFTPQVSILTALIELLFAVIIFIYFRKSKAAKFAIVFILLLGLYQFTEFKVCTSSNFNFWARIGFVVYTFLPAIALHFMLKITKSRLNKLWIYILPIIFGLTALFYKNFIVTGFCGKFFIFVRTIFYQFDLHPILYVIYSIFYYFGFIALSAVIGVRQVYYEKNKMKRRIYLAWVLAILLITLPAYLLVIIIPSINGMFPSVYCKFALLFAILVFIVVYFDNKYRIIT